MLYASGSRWICWRFILNIVAFANTQGGKLIVGVDDKTHQIVGVENSLLHFLQSPL